LVNALNGLDGKSALIGGALVLGALVATQGGLFPLLLVGGIAYLIGSKKGWWSGGPRRADPATLRQSPPGIPPFFADWHRQAHANEAAYRTTADRPAADQPATSASAPAQPREAEVRVPVAPVPAPPAGPTATVHGPAAAEEDDRRTGGGNGAPLV
jgi:hypothetical protein